MTDAAPLELEASGETVGEAKWLALRELERLHPRLDREAVTFEVLSEGERGLLGVGTSPARVLARLDPARVPADTEAGLSKEPELADRIVEIVERVAAAVGTPGGVEIVDTDDVLRVSASGPDAGLLIGRGGRTIDAVQYVVGAIAHRLQGDGGRSVEVDAASYRERRRARLTATAMNAAERARTTGRPVTLEPMTAGERKLVHLTLQDVDDVQTESEGDEPARYVVVSPIGG